MSTIRGDILHIIEYLYISERVKVHPALLSDSTTGQSSFRPLAAPSTPRAHMNAGGYTAKKIKKTVESILCLEQQIRVHFQWRKLATILGCCDFTATFIFLGTYVNSI